MKKKRKADPAREKLIDIITAFNAELMGRYSDLARNGMPRMSLIDALLKDVTRVSNEIHITSNRVVLSLNYSCLGTLISLLVLGTTPKVRKKEIDEVLEKSAKIIKQLKAS